MMLAIEATSRQWLAFAAILFVCFFVFLCMWAWFEARKRSNREKRTQVREEKLERIEQSLNGAAPSHARRRSNPAMLRHR